MRKMMYINGERILLIRGGNKQMGLERMYELVIMFVILTMLFTGLFIIIS